MNPAPFTMYCDIYLLKIEAKNFARVLLKQIQNLIES